MMLCNAEVTKVSIASEKLNRLDVLEAQPQSQITVANPSMCR